MLFRSITDPRMTRFNISLQEGVEMVLWALENAWGGEIFVPKIPSYRITDVAKAIAPNSKYPISGIRPGEKIHEEMITSSDSHSTVDLGNYYAILPTNSAYTLSEYCSKTLAIPVEPGFNYNSGDNKHFLTIEELQALIREHVDPSFVAS